MNNSQKLFLFDAYAIIYRAYYAFINRPLINSKGKNTSAIYGFTNILTDILNREKPEYAAVVFDPPSPTFRTELYDQYKANRLATPEDIKESVPVIKEIIQSFNIQSIEIEGFEADDVIGTLAKNAEKEGLSTYMVTQDKDYMQLVSDNIFMYKPSRESTKYDIIGSTEANEFFNVDHPLKVIDVLALWGDATDNVPGAPGIGEKSAKALIAEYGSVEEIYLHLDELKPRQKENLQKYKDQVLMSKKLVTICTDVPVDFTYSNLKVGEMNKKKAENLFKDLEFRTLTSRVAATFNKEPKQQSLFEDNPHESDILNKPGKDITTVTHNYKVLENLSQIEDLTSLILRQPAFCFDVETSALSVDDAELVGMAISFKRKEAYYIPFEADRNVVFKKLQLLHPLFDNNQIIKIGQNLKFDLKILLKYNVDVKGPFFDTMIAHYLLLPDLRHNLEYLSEIYLDYHMVTIENLIGKKGTAQKSMREVDPESIKEYAGEDADITWQLYEKLWPEIEKNGLTTLAEKVEMPLVKVLAEIERTGFNINLKHLEDYSGRLKSEVKLLESDIFELAGNTFNINSPKQLGEILFEKLKITEKAQKTKTNQYSTSEDVLIKLRDNHEIIPKILEYRTIQKLISTYVDALPGIISNQSGKIHTSFDQAWVSTGRLSSRNPNLQNIPVRDERGKEIRKAFIPDNEQYVLLSADYSQIELRLMAHLSEDENLINAFINDADIHVSTAAKIFKKRETDITSEMRSKAKTANFGIIYGISAFGLAQRLNISRSEASSLINDYFESFPKVKSYMEHSIRNAREKGYVQTIMGRRRFLPDIHSRNAVVRNTAERNAINAPIQGSAADIIKLAMVRIQDKIRNNYKSKMILQVHDELIFNVLGNELDQIKEIVRHEMEHVFKLKIPLTVDIGVGNNWLEAH